MRDSSLDEFLDTGPDGSTDGDGARSGDDPTGPDAGDGPSGDGAGERPGLAPDDRAVEPAIRRIAPDPSPAESTYAFSPEGSACAACGARVERRWRDDSGLVCDDCKEW